MSPNLAASGVAAQPIAAVSHPLPAEERPSCSWDGRPASGHPVQASKGISYVVSLQALVLL